MLRHRLWGPVSIGAATLICSVAHATPPRGKAPAATASGSASSKPADAKATKSESPPSKTAKPEPAAPAKSTKPADPRAAKPGYKPDPRRGYRGKKPPPAPCSARWRPSVPHGYRAAVDSWHRPPTVAAKTDAQGRPYFTLDILNTGEHIEVPPQHDTGRFSAADLDRLSHALRDQRGGNEHPFDPDVIDLVYDLQLHFKANAIRVISGYRTPHTHGHSNHGRGRAIDLIVPGASDEDVAKYVRSKGYVGVGVYPTSGFVHVDVRPVSYYWIDNSGPGQRNCERSTRGGEAKANDATAKSAGRKPPRPWQWPSSDVDAAWKERRPTPDVEPDTHEDQVEEDDLDSDP